MKYNNTIKQCFLVFAMLFVCTILISCSVKETKSYNIDSSLKERLKEVGTRAEERERERARIEEARKKESDFSEWDLKLILHKLERNYLHIKGSTPEEKFLTVLEDYNNKKDSLYEAIYFFIGALVVAVILITIDSDLFGIFVIFPLFAFFLVIGSGIEYSFSYFL